MSADHHTCFVCGRPVEVSPELEKPGTLPLCPEGWYDSDTGERARLCKKAFDRWNISHDQLAIKVAG